jgi:formate dehydrogenase subunit gamma
MAERDELEVASVGYRLTHWLNLILFLTLLITGLVLLEIEVFAYIVYPLGAPIATLLGLDPGTGAVTAGVQIARMLHRLAGPLWGFIIVVYVAYLLVSGRLETLRVLRKPVGQQLREASTLLSHYLLGRELPEDVRKGLDRHNVLAVYLALLLAIGVVLVGFSGLAIAYLDLTPSQHRLMLLLHDIGFYLTVIFLIGHVFAVFHPSNVILLKAMFGDGRVPLSWAREHMNAYVERVLDRR